jgi:3-hydroxymyristoyl/3-hydroxydecanoyl-(acyl carrier protein) dehydratase
MSGDGLPQVYPFRFVDTVLRGRNTDFSEGTVGVRVSANGRAATGEAWASPLLLLEAIAQAALLLEGGDPEIGRAGFLAGIEGFEAKRAPRAGETLEINVRLAARFGAILKFEGEVRSAKEMIARGGILVRKGETPAEG